MIQTYNTTSPTKVVAHDKVVAPAVKTQEPSSASPSSFHISPDKVKIGSAPRGINMEPIKLFDEPKPATEEKEGPWTIKRMHVNAGYIANHNIMHTGTMHIQNAQHNTDVNISGIKQVPRYNWEYLDAFSGERFAPDEPQFIVGVNMEFANKFGIELDAKHNKVIVGDYSQMVHFDGMLNGEYVNQDAPLNTFMQQHEQTYGNMQISVLGTRNFDLPAPKNHRFSYILKAGPSLIVSANRTSVLNGSQFEQTTSPICVVGGGATVENGLRYEFGPKLGRMGVEVAYGLSYLNYAKYPVVGGGTGSHDAVAGQFSVKLTKAIEFKKN